MIDRQKQLKKVMTTISSLQSGEFFGQLMLDFQAGNIVLFRVNQTLKLESGDNTCLFVKQP